MTAPVELLAQAATPGRNGIPAAPPTLYGSLGRAVQRIGPGGEPRDRVVRSRDHVAREIGDDDEVASLRRIS